LRRSRKVDFKKGISISWFNKFEKNAKKRKIEFDISIEDVLKVYLDQGKVCSLSGIPIGWTIMGKSHNISIDRIDSDKGYYTDNIQLVYPKINMMKFTYSQDEFIDMCKLVSNHTMSLKDQESGLDVLSSTINE
tara:strand:- start:380 stop:781 length:402 start_codon:yes stop_codon:yes gene_type:complete